ncbi:MAG: DASS family sodium-coupled anion symporter [Rhodothermales bacterium]|nr:DASS family sodium-coupled anion symporter [Rhodothermales bacterium]
MFLAKARYNRVKVGLFLGPAIFCLILFLAPPEGLSGDGWNAAAVVALMATWWITEAIPISATALIPVVAFPLLGVVSLQDATSPYADPIIFLFMGGFLIALSMQKWDLHRRIALYIIRCVGTSPAGLVGGFMIAAALLSMWISNTATALMLLPVGLSVVHLAERTPGFSKQSVFPVVLLLGIAYGCNIGGMATIIGTPPNALLAGFIKQEYGTDISFVKWMMVGVPLLLVSLPLAYFILIRVSFSLKITDLVGVDDLVATEVHQIGRMSREEMAVALVFSGTALLWIFRPLLMNLIPGLSDAGIAMLGGLILFLIPSSSRQGEFLLDWETARRLPWETLILFGGGLSLASAFTKTGLSTWIGVLLQGAGSLPIVVVVLITSSVIIFLTELTSNTATTATLLPVVAALAVAIGHDPMLLAVPAVLSASCAFMLPVATPPNAIVYSSNRVSIPQMARAGIILNFVFIGVITMLGLTLVRWVFGTALP